MAETFEQKILWIKRIKRMILMYQNDIDHYTKLESEAMKRCLQSNWSDFMYNFEYNQYVREVWTLKQEKKMWIELYYRDLQNL